MKPNITVPETIILELFDAVEIESCCEKDGICEPIPESDMGKDASAEYFWSVYLHYDSKHPLNKGFGGVECVADLPTEEAALAYARGLQEALGAIIGSRLIRNL